MATAHALHTKASQVDIVRAARHPVPSSFLPRAASATNHVKSPFAPAASAQYFVVTALTRATHQNEVFLESQATPHAPHTAKTKTKDQQPQRPHIQTNSHNRLTQ